MLMINLLILLVYLMLAILSRKHFSKYKNVVKAIAVWMYLNWNKRIKNVIKRSDFRKLNVVSDSKLDEVIKEYYVKIISICMVIIFVINSACIVLSVSKKFNKDKQPQNVIERGGYDEETVYYDVLIGGDEKKLYKLEVYPKQYTEEEFLNEADKVFAELESDILGNNPDLEHIGSDLKLPASDRRGIFEIDWVNDYPEYIFPSGKIRFDEISKDIKIVLKARITYLDMSAEHEYQLTLIKKSSSEDIAEDIVAVLNGIEAENRDKSSFKLPDEIDRQSISLKKTDEDFDKRLFGLGLLVCTITIIISKSSLNQRVKQRDDVLLKKYPSFVNRLWLFLGTGMGIKACFIKIIDESEEDLLIRELKYTLNQINSGMDEAVAYEELGTRIGLPQYSRLMSHISQNIRMGTKDLRKLMLDEVKESLIMRKEYAKKKGEEASVKLVFPMIILMAVVIVIIMIPAFVSF